MSAGFFKGAALIGICAVVSDAGPRRVLSRDLVAREAGGLTAVLLVMIGSLATIAATTRPFRRGLQATG